MAFKLKAGKEGPMKKNFPSIFKKKTKFIDKIKSAGGAIVDTIKEEFVDPSDVGPGADTMTRRLQKYYRKRKKEARKTYGAK